jgi:hypothetical protein
MELIRSSYGENNGMLRFTYYVRPECEAKKFRGWLAYIRKKNFILVLFKIFLFRHKYRAF